MPKNTKKNNKKEQIDQKEVKADGTKKEEKVNKAEKENIKQDNKNKTAQNSDTEKIKKRDNKEKKNNRSEENKRIEIKNDSKVKNNEISEKEKSKKDKNTNNIQNNKENKKGKNNRNSKKQKAIKKTEKTDKKKYDVKNVQKENTVNNTEKEHITLIKLEDIKNIFKSKRTIPKEDLKKINKPVFENVLVAIAIMIYFIFLILGFYNIEFSVYQTDLKVFAMCILFLSILLLEKAYREDSIKLAIFGIETMVIAIITLALIYINIMLSTKYINIILVVSYVLAIYYIVKAIIVDIKERKKYFIDNVKEMINTDE